jgi:hypothetical protein
MAPELGRFFGVESQARNLILSFAATRCEAPSPTPESRLTEPPGPPETGWNGLRPRGPARGACAPGVPHFDNVRN